MDNVWNIVIYIVVYNEVDGEATFIKLCLWKIANEVKFIVVYVGEYKYRFDNWV